MINPYYQLSLSLVPYPNSQFMSEIMPAAYKESSSFIVFTTLNQSRCNVAFWTLINKVHFIVKVETHLYKWI